MNSSVLLAGVKGASFQALELGFTRAFRSLKVTPANVTVIAACSGGADSAAAVMLLRQAAPDARIVACYVNHRLRPSAAIRRDVAAVRSQARLAQAEFCMRSLRRLRCEQPAPGRSAPGRLAPGRLAPGRLAPGRSVMKRAANLEERAREARYAVLHDVAQQHGAAFVMTGHHADDVAETVLLGLMRGSGLDGLAAMPAKRKLSAMGAPTSAVWLVRPLLFARRADLRAFVAAREIPVSEDETNEDLGLRRNAVRALIRDLERTQPGASRNITRAAKLLRGDSALLLRIVRPAWERCKQQPGGRALSARALKRLPWPLLRHVIRYAVKAEVGSARNFGFQHCHAIAAALKNGRGGRYYAGSVSVVLSGGNMLIERSGSSAPQKGACAATPVALPLAAKGRVVTPFGTLSFQVQKNAAAGAPAFGAEAVLRLDLESVQHSLLAVRLPRTGDKCMPSGRSSLVSLARFLAKAGVPKGRRPHTPLLCAENRIVAALPVRVMEPFGAKLNAPVLELRWQPLPLADNTK